LWGLYRWHRAVASSDPQFERLTFDVAGLIDADARFTPDGESIVYSVGGPARPTEVFLQRIGSSGPQSLGLRNDVLASISRQGELAVICRSFEPCAGCPMKPGTLARLPLGGSAPRQLLADVDAADWSRDGELAIVRVAGRRSRLEYPIGKVLFENAGRITSPRFSPSGDAVAFVDHPMAGDDRGSVVIVDRKGSRQTLSGFWESLDGLAWTPSGDEVWFAAARSGASRSLYAVTRSGRERRILSMAGGLRLNDISHDGRVLLARENRRLGIHYVQSGQSQPKDLSWKDQTVVADFSGDGRHLLFGEFGENSGFSYQVGLRPIDGSPPVILGSGIAQSLSPDGQWALSLNPPPNEQMVLLPAGAGTSRILDRGPVEHFGTLGARWFPDSHRIVFVASQAGHGPRCYVQSIDAGPPKPFTQEGTTLCAVSPNGTIAATTEDLQLQFYSSVSSGKPEKVLTLEPAEVAVGWTADGKSLYVSRARGKTVNILRLDVASGRREPWIRLPPVPEAVQPQCESLVVAPDGQAYAYTYYQGSSDLYVVRGVK